MDFGDVGADEADFSVDGGVGGEEGLRVGGELIGAVEKRERGDFGFVDYESRLVVGGRHFEQGPEPRH